MPSSNRYKPKYDQVDLLKYDIIMCPHCGYAALSRFFKFVTSLQSKNIKATISASFKPQTEVKETYSYEDALERYKLTLANAIVKQALFLGSILFLDFLH